MTYVGDCIEGPLTPTGSNTYTLQNPLQPYLERIPEDCRELTITFNKAQKGQVHLTLHGEVSIEVTLEEGAELELVLSLEEGTVMQVQSSVLDHAKLHTCIHSEGGGIEATVRSRVKTQATSDLDWLLLGSKKNTQKIIAENLFEGRDGRGQMRMVGVVEDQAKISCKGTILIAQQGNGTDSYLTQEVLMLDPSAKVDAVPGLEIKADDVKASHSATVRRIHPEDLFYLTSRGVSLEDAREMVRKGVMEGFWAQVGEELRYRK